MLTLAFIQIFLLIAVVLLLIFRRSGKPAAGDLAPKLEDISVSLQRTEGVIRDDLRASKTEFGEQLNLSRQAASSDARSLREEVVASVDRFGNNIAEVLKDSRRSGAEENHLLRSSLESRMDQFSVAHLDSSEQLRGELKQQIDSILNTISTGISDAANKQREASLQLRDSVDQSVLRLGGDLRESSESLKNTVQQRFDQLSLSNERSQQSVRETLQAQLDKISEANKQKLEEMRQTVDEKLHSTLERRLTESFGIVTEQLGLVQRGLGEMKDLANGVGDLKRVLTNVKTRGGYGEVQVESLLDLMLAPDQYSKNVAVKIGSQERVEFAIKLPGAEDGQFVYLPIDAKFPREAWERLEDAQTKGDQDLIKDAGAKLESAIKSAAKSISDKYVNPPGTTGFAVMFLATEGLFAEVVKRPGLVDELQTKFHVCIAGPTTLAALLTSLQMGFRTLAIQKKGSEVWKILAATKVEFGNFGALMETVERQVGTVQNTLRKVNSKTRTINRKLRAVDTLEMQEPEATALLGAGNLVEEEDVVTESEPAISGN